MRTIFYNKKIITFSAIFFAISALLNSETFRVHRNIVHKIDLSKNSEKVLLGINDALSIVYPEEQIYLQGIALDIKIPELAVTWRDSMAWSIYDSVTPDPQNNIIDYSGKALNFALLPPKHSVSLIIPLTENNTIKENPYAQKFEFIPNIESGYIFLRLQQVMKGTPDEFEQLKFEITVRPLLTNQGKFELELISPNKNEAVKQCALFMDEKPFDFSKDGFYLESGVHTFSLVSEFYRSELRTIHIDQAKTTKLSINLRGIEPSVIITAPVSATVQFDGNPVTSNANEFPITEGEHKVKFNLGNYEVEKKFTAVKGQSYRVSLVIEADVSEEN